MRDIMVDKINYAINTEIRPFLAKHNGDIELVKINDGVVEVKLLGSCSNCPSARFTMEDVVTNVLIKIPEVKKIKLIDPISSEMLEFARQILNK